MYPEHLCHATNARMHKHALWMQKLGQIVDPLVQAHRTSFLQRTAESNHWLVVFDEPLLFDTQTHEVCVASERTGAGLLGDMR
jgi:hypothetical protein